ncbi:hypothetical protein [Mucilaginibacter sp. UYCu711]|uniref:hypothetical protein n=1 Tax=Mucilaginibacter sp. UYCu711 TaxID=3156339 RepID=UPI003D1A11D5
MADNFEAIKNTLDTIRKEIDIRYGLDKLPFVKDTFRQIDYVLSKMHEWIQFSNLYKNHDAEVFMNAFEGYFRELNVMIDEMDSRKVY